MIPLLLLSIFSPMSNFLFGLLCAFILGWCACRFAGAGNRAELAWRRSAMSEEHWAKVDALEAQDWAEREAADKYLDDLAEQEKVP